MSEVTTEAEVVQALTEDADKGTVIIPGEVASFPRARHVIDAEYLLAAPRRTKGTYKPDDTQSFINYVTEHDAQQETTIWIDRFGSPPSMLAVLNDSSGDTPGWADHRVDVKLAHTPEWCHWVGKDGQWMEQQAFAEHIEDGLLEVHDPPAADLLETIQSLKGHVNAEWQASARLSNGAQGFSYVEQVSATGATTRGEVEVPQLLSLVVPVFYGEDPVAVGARVRYRVRNSELMFSYRLDRPYNVVNTSIAAIKERLEKSFRRVYYGAPA